MLVLTRKKGEAIIITAPDGKTIEIVVSAFRDGQVRLGIDAPREYKVMRDEINE